MCGNPYMDDEDECCDCGQCCDCHRVPEPEAEPEPDSEPTNRGRDVSRALTEVRTVLSRAETALSSVTNSGEYFDYLYRGEGRRGSRTSPDARDPDADEMAADLRMVVQMLGRWRKTGAAKWPAGDWVK